MIVKRHCIVKCMYSKLEIRFIILLIVQLDQRSYFLLHLVLYVNIIICSR